MALIVSAVNLSHLAEVSDYEVKAYINAQQIAGFTVKNHVRSAGAAALLRLIADAWDAEPTEEELKEWGITVPIPFRRPVKRKASNDRRKR